MRGDGMAYLAYLVWLSQVSFALKVQQYIQVRTNKNVMASTHPFDKV